MEAPRVYLIKVTKVADDNHYTLDRDQIHGFIHFYFGGKFMLVLLTSGL